MCSVPSALCERTLTLALNAMRLVGIHRKGWEPCPLSASTVDLHPCTAAVPPSVPCSWCASTAKWRTPSPLLPARSPASSPPATCTPDMRACCWCRCSCRVRLAGRREDMWWLACCAQPLQPEMVGSGLARRLSRQQMLPLFLFCWAVARQQRMPQITSLAELTSQTTPLPLQLTGPTPALNTYLAWRTPATWPRWRCMPHWPMWAWPPGPGGCCRSGAGTARCAGLLVWQWGLAAICRVDWQHPPPGVLLLLLGRGGTQRAYCRCSEQSRGGSDCS